MARKHRDRLNCPLCNYSDPDQYELLFHVETVHPESSGPSPFTSEDAPSEVAKSPGAEMEEGKDRSPEYIECQCGEFCLLAEFESHLEMHYAEGVNIEETQNNYLDPASLSSRDKSSSSRKSSVGSSQTKDSISTQKGLASPRSSTRRRSHSEGRKSQGFIRDFMDVLLHSSSPPRAKIRRGPQRLGRKELGPHAHEDRMPEWLRYQLEAGAKVTILTRISPDGRLCRVENVANEFEGVVPVLAQLCEQDPAVARAYLCYPEVTHVVKMAKEGGFCGYRNIQMMVSYIRDARSEGHQRFAGRLPSVIQLQDLIEAAWDRGFNTIGRVETGGIRGTRKYIGTPEAQALLQSLDIGCSAYSFNSAKSLINRDELLDSVEEYFLNGHPNLLNKVCRTSLPPIYFQHPGHSLTIVGFEVLKNGARNLLVFDPMFKPSPGITHLIGHRVRTNAPEKLLKAYRRDEPYLLKYPSYETLQLTSQVPPREGWHGL